MSYNTTLFINSPLSINQNSSVYGKYINEGNYDYTFLINVSCFNSNITGIFSNASFIQNSVNIENYDVNLVLQDHFNFVNWDTLFKNQNIITVQMGDSINSFASLNPSENEKLGDRLLEIVAHKIFGHGQARAAIKNDDQFYGYDITLWDHLAQSISSDVFKNDIFKQYVGMGRYNAFNINDYNDIDKYINFNFADLTFDFPLYVTGQIMLDSSLTNKQIQNLSNGPNVGGTILTNGQYNIPVLVKFHTSHIYSSYDFYKMDSSNKTWNLLPNLNFKKIVDQINTFYGSSCNSTMQYISCYSSNSSIIKTSSDGGNTFKTITISTTSNILSSFIYVSPNGKYQLYGDFGLYLSSDYGVSFLPVLCYLSEPVHILSSSFINGFVSDDGQTIIALNFIGLFMTRTGGTLNSVQKIFWPNATFNYDQNKQRFACSKSGQYIMCTGRNYANSLFLSSNYCTTVTEILSGPSIYNYPISCAMSDSGQYQIFTACNSGGSGAQIPSNGITNYLYYSSDYGTSFTSILQTTNTEIRPLSFGPIVANISSDGSIITALYSTSLKITNNCGITWSSVPIPLTFYASNINIRNYSISLTNYYYLINVIDSTKNQSCILIGA